MKKTVLFVVLLVFASVTFAQLSKSVTLTIAGNLSTALTSEELNTITDLTVTGNIDACDFKTMRDLMPVLANIDLSGVSIAAYNGTEGTVIGNINFPANSVPESALNSKTSLKSVVLANSITSISHESFLSCSYLESVFLPSNLISIDDRAFGWCNLTSISLPSTLQSIGNYAFATNNIPIAVIPAGVQNIGSGVFYQNRSLTEINVSPTNSNYSSIDGVLFNEDLSELIHYPNGKTNANYTLPDGVQKINARSFDGGNSSLRNLTIPEGVIEIGFWAFGNLWNLESIDIPSSITVISDGAFGGQHNYLQSIKIRKNIPVSISSDAFGDVNKSTCVLYVPFGTKSAYQAANQWKDFQNIVEMEPTYEMPLQVEAGGLAALLPQSVRDTITYLALTGTIDARDFRFMRDFLPMLTHLDITGVKVLSYSGIEGPLLADWGYFTYPENAIPEFSFNGKSSLITVIIPNNIVSLNEAAFQSCTMLKSISLPSTLTSIGDFSLSQCTSLTEIIIPSSLETIGAYAFQDCRMVSEIFIPQSVLNIGSSAFSRCNGLGKIKAFSKLPISLGNSVNVFDYIDKTLCQLYVPFGSKSAYQAADQWKDFQNIVEMEPTYEMPLQVEAGGLASLLPQSVRDTITYLALTGSIDARDFKTMRDLMPVLANLDLSDVIIVEYIGTEGTLPDSWGSYTFPANALPNLAFYNGSNGIAKATLKTLIFPTYTESINDMAFYHCTGLTNIIIPESVVSIGINAFTGFSGLIEVNEDNDYYSGAEGILYNKIKTTLIQCPTSKTGSLSLPETVTIIANEAFNGCSGLISLILPPALILIDNYAFNMCTGLTDITFPSSLTTINQGAFSKCFGLTTITIPGSVTAIGSAAFESCSNLSSIIAFGTSPVNLSSVVFVFNGVDKTTCTLYVPAGSLNLYRNATEWKDFQNIVEMEPTYEMPLQVEAGGLAALLPQSVRDTITYLALTGTIDARDFKTMRDDMPLLAKVDISGVTILAYTGPDGTSITGNKSYPENTVPETSFLNSSYRGKTSITNIELPNTVQFIGHQAFRSCTGLTSMTFPSSLLSISSLAFGACFNLTSVTIPASVTTIGNYAFGDSPVYFSVDENNPSYTSVDGILFNKSKTFLFQAPPSISGNFVIPSTVLTIGGYAFSRASGLLSVTIPSSVKTLMEGAFTACEGLSTIEFPTSVTSIGNFSFQSCYGLTSIIAPWPIPLSLGSGVFNSIDKTSCTLKVPQGTKAAYQAADQWKDFQNIVEMDQEIQMTYVPDDNFEQALLDLGYDSGALDDYVLTANIRGLTSLDVSGKEIIDLTGIEDFVSLEILNCSGNQLSALILNKNINLQGLYCGSNNLTILDVSACTKLTNLHGYNNLLTSIDLGNCVNLLTIDVQSNQLTNINVGNNLKLVWLNLTNNPLTALDIKNNTLLEALICSNFQFTKIDLFNNIALKILGLYNGSLTDLNINNNTNLNVLWCYNNSINSIDASRNTSITTLYCQNNQLTFLNIQNGNNNNMVANETGLNAKGNPNLTCIQVDDPDLAATYTEWFKDPGANYSILCTDNCPQHFQTVWEGTSGLDHMNINVTDAKINGIDLEAGDEIGVFDGNLCVGYGKVTQTISQQNILNIKVSKNDGSGNGFTAERDVMYKIWDCSEQSEFIVNDIHCFNTQSIPVTCLPFEAFATVFVKLSAIIDICHNLTLKTGWNIISIPNQPQNTDIEYTFNPFIIKNSLAKIQDESGNTMEDWGIYGGWKNNIGNLSPTEGYKVKANKNDNFEVCGAPVQYPFAIPLKSGWNIMGYPQTTAYDALKVLKQLIDSGKLVKVQDEAGNSIEDWGIYGGMKNNIGDFAPGKGYNIKLNADVTLWINESYTKSSSIQPEVVASNHFKPAFNGNGIDHMNINLVGLPLNILQAGDELAVFDGTTCVGAVTLTTRNISNQSVSIAASAKDNKGMPGFSEGNPIVLKLYREGALYNLGFQPISNDKTVFVRNGSLFVFIDVLESSAKNELIRNPKIHCFPNPFSDAISIEVFVPGEPGLQVTIHDSLGRKVKDLYEGTNNGKITLIWDGINESGQKVSPGIYSVQANKHNIKIIRK